jgi:hypothetical protein
MSKENLNLAGCHKMTANLIATGQVVGVRNDDRRARSKSENQHETKKSLSPLDRGGKANLPLAQGQRIMRDTYWASDTTGYVW